MNLGVTNSSCTLSEDAIDCASDMPFSITDRPIAPTTGHSGYHSASGIHCKNPTDSVIPQPADIAPRHALKRG